MVKYRVSALPPTTGDSVAAWANLYCGNTSSGGGAAPSGAARGGFGAGGGAGFGSTFSAGDVSDCCGAPGFCGGLAAAAGAWVFWSGDSLFAFSLVAALGAS